MATHYEILGISQTATPAEIREAWRQRCLETHPDKAGNTPENNAKFSAVQNAYETLSEPARRVLYDQQL
ncbi:DnaJ domain-containing protein, partial [Cercophora newfieldiana]